MSIGRRAAQQALQLVGAPYRYGGNTPRGFDCSGLVHYSYARAGTGIPRTTRGQRMHSRRLSPKQLQAGDLLFFNQEGKRASHVALYVGNNRFVHAPSSGKTVQLSTFSNPYWQRHFLDARRLEF
jgi:murein DD-endopeptidase